jgi:thiol:disulfide interchange protein DsbD
MVADWTNYDPEITKTLEALGRSGVPLYVLYSPDGKTEILPELLTTKAAVDALRKARR